MKVNGTGDKYGHRARVHSCFCKRNSYPYAAENHSVSSGRQHGEKEKFRAILLDNLRVHSIIASIIRRFGDERAYSLLIASGCFASRKFA